jgi:DNA topoisomerase IB
MAAAWYRYHDLWRKQRDQEKHDPMLEFSAALPPA